MIYYIYHMYIYIICTYDIYIYTHTAEYYSAIKKIEIMPFAVTWMGLEIIILGKVSQTEESKYCMICLYDVTHMWNIKKKTRYK